MLKLNLITLAQNGTNVKAVGTAEAFFDDQREIKLIKSSDYPVKSALGLIRKRWDTTMIAPITDGVALEGL